MSASTVSATNALHAADDAVTTLRRHVTKGLHLGRSLGRAALTTVPGAAFGRFVLAPVDTPPPPEELRGLVERAAALVEDDWQHAEDGTYPRALVTAFDWPRHLKAFAGILLDAPDVRRRARDNKWNEVPGDPSLPKYFRRTFHFQTGGYLDRRSAERYETQVEILFGGLADAMRRQVLPPLVKAVQGLDRPAILDVATGTGAMLRLAAATLPRARFTGLDLSAAYVAHARRRLDGVQDLSLVVENAEAMPFTGARFDAVTCVYLLHELPSEVRTTVLREIARVLKPGGTLVLADSVQLADAQGIETAVQNFPKRFHEPFYAQYLRDDLRARFADAGLVVERESSHFLTKVMVARKRA